VFDKILESFKDDQLEHVSGMDAAFLYGETPNSPMHIGSVVIIEGDLKFETFRRRIASRIHMLPRLRKRLIYVPFRVDYPYWVDDPNFDLDMHIDHIALPKPGSWKELRRVASRIFSEHLDHSRPLWSFTFIEGLDNIPQVPKGSVAIVTKIHHVAIDGMAGAGILGLLFDFSPNVPPDPEPEPYSPKPLPNELAVALQSTLSFAEDPLKFPKLLTQTLTSSLKAGVFTRAQKAELPTAPFTAPQTPWNHVIAARRTWNTSILELKRVKKIRKIMGTTLNDVILAFCAGALRRYLNEKDQLPTKPLVGHIPISIRTEEGDDSNGNKISAMLVQLATNIDDPIERLEVIHENTVRGKTYQNAVGAETLSKMAEIVPFGIANQAAQLYSRFNVAEMHNPVFNLTITNVPGPQFPLYVAGHQLMSIMGAAPIIDGMGLIITIFSYNGHLTISSTSDVRSMPDIDKFSRYIRESANELEKLVLERRKKKEKKIEAQADTTQIDDFFTKLKKAAKAQPELTEKVEGVYHFKITGAAEADWRVDFNKQPASIRRGTVAEPTAIFTMDNQHFELVANGLLDLPTAFIQGRMQVDGERSAVLEIGNLVKALMAE
jgi:WS/DGAT/MGAT family acyltransferase